MRYYLTVDRLNEGHRGIFRDAEGNAFWKDGEPHTDDEMFKIVGHFEYILSPMSIAYTDEQIKRFTKWVPLAEYSGRFGVWLREE
jgi:hypothetical protein